MLVPRGQRQVGNYYPRNSYYSAAGAAGGASLAYGAAKKAYQWYSQRPSYPKKKRGPRRPYRKNVPVAKKQRTLKNQVKELTRISKADTATHIHRKRNMYRLLSSVGTKEHLGFTLNGTTSIEEALANLQYYDPATPGTLVTAAGATGTYSRQYYFKRMSNTATFRNNYQVPVSVQVLFMTPKSDTGISVLTAFESGIDDIPSTPANNSPLVYASDSPQLNDLWRTIKSTKRVLQPGEQFTFSHSWKPIMYNPSTTDNHNLQYQSAINGGMALVFVEGLVGHDTSLDQQNTTAAGVDIMLVNSYEIQYQGGADIHNVFIDDNGDTPTNGLVVSSWPVADNIGYSVA